MRLYNCQVQILKSGSSGLIRPVISKSHSQKSPNRSFITSNIHNSSTFNQLFPSFDINFEKSTLFQINQAKNRNMERLVCVVPYSGELNVVMREPRQQKIVGETALILWATFRIFFLVQAKYDDVFWMTLNSNQGGFKTVVDKLGCGKWMPQGNKIMASLYRRNSQFVLSQVIENTKASDAAVSRTSSQSRTKRRGISVASVIKTETVAQNPLQTVRGLLCGEREMENNLKVASQEVNLCLSSKKADNSSWGYKVHRQKKQMKIAQPIDYESFQLQNLRTASTPISKLMILENGFL